MTKRGESQARHNRNKKVSRHLTVINPDAAGIDVGASVQPAREEIPVAPQPAGFQGLAGPRGAADDLKKLTGVSGAIEKKFNDLGIFHYWQLAKLDHDTAHQIGEEVGLPSRADGWVAQAKALTAEAE